VVQSQRGIEGALVPQLALPPASGLSLSLGEACRDPRYVLGPRRPSVGNERATAAPPA
jgi:hypothetical protein